MRHLRSLLAPTTLLLFAALSGCGDTSSDSDGNDKDDGLLESCACPQGKCAEAECVLIVNIDNNCDGWGEAKVYVNSSGDGEPAGTASVDSPFKTCEPFRAPTFTEPGETFTFIIESEDGRLAAGSTAPGIDYTCTGSLPFEFTATCE